MGLIHYSKYPELPLYLYFLTVIKSNMFAYTVCRREDTKLTTTVTLNTENKENKGLVMLRITLVTFVSRSVCLLVSIIKCLSKC